MKCSTCSNLLQMIDVDVMQRERQRVIDYLREKYGYVYQVRTFTAMKPKASLQRACQCLGISPSIQRELSKRVIEGEDGKEAFKDIAITKETKPIIELAIHLQGIVSNTSVHASAVLVFPKDPTNFCALEKQGDNLVCAYDYHELEELGLAKIDVLGLKNMDIIEDTIQLIHKDNPLFDINNIPIDDKNTYNMLCKEHSDGVFQIESNIMKKLLGSVNPNKFEDLYAIVALGRPAVLSVGLHNEYIKEKSIAGQQSKD